MHREHDFVLCKFPTLLVEYLLRTNNEKSHVRKGDVVLSNL